MRSSQCDDVVAWLTLQRVADDSVVRVQVGSGGSGHEISGGHGSGRVPPAAAQGVLHVVQDRVGAVDHEIVALLLAQIPRKRVRVVASITCAFHGPNREWMVPKNSGQCLCWGFTCCCVVVGAGAVVGGAVRWEMIGQVRQVGGDCRADR